ncbi:hypothetical protein HD554DRAFT_2060265 [Boletus coccyginus]|nr:hypothetical protein HD554DRAFT_2060265 [Boletus coccyginus]
MDDVSKESLSSGFGFGMGRLGCVLGTTVDVIGTAVVSSFEEVRKSNSFSALGVWVEYGGGLRRDTCAQRTVLRGAPRLTRLLMSALTRLSAGNRHKYAIPSHSCTDATNLPEGEKRTVLTSRSCGRCCPTGLPVVAFQKRTVLSQDALARIDPSGERESERMMSV